MRRAIEIFIISLVLVSCSKSTVKAPIEDSVAEVVGHSREHVVAPGETLYSISVRYDIDYRILRRINNLDSNYSISPGQRLILESSKVGDYSGKKEPASDELTQVVKTIKTVAEEVFVSIKNQSQLPVESSPAIKKSEKIKWVRPIGGRVLANFRSNDGLNKGVDLVGKLGEPVLAAGDGEVVFAGSGSRGFGKLVILKHNEKYLSAYAYNRVLTVVEGDRVRAGTKIAEVGIDSSSQTPKLHFEIRIDGKPVDPLKFLPAQ